MANKKPKGAYNRAHIFYRENYDYWKTLCVRCVLHARIPLKEKRKKTQSLQLLFNHHPPSTSATVAALQRRPPLHHRKSSYSGHRPEPNFATSVRLPPTINKSYLHCRSPTPFSVAALQNHFFLPTRTTERPNFFRFLNPFPQSRFFAPMLFSSFMFLSSFYLTLLYSSLSNHLNSRSPLVEIHHFFFSAHNSLD